jgi:tight adherence protein B
VGGGSPAQAALLLPALVSTVAAVLLLVPRSVVTRRRGGRVSGSGRTAVAWAGATAVAGVAVVGVRGTHLGVAAVTALALWLVAQAVDRARAERRAEARRRAVVDYCEALLGELEAGQPVQEAVQRCSAQWPESAPVASAARLGADVPAALREAASAPGAAALRRLAAAWELSSATGAGLAFALRQVIRTVRNEQLVAARVGAELASARATARLVIVLPAVVLVAAQGVGAQPWHFLLETVPGVVCLAVGVVLSAAGLRWIDAIGHAARGTG